MLLLFSFFKQIPDGTNSVKLMLMHGFAVYSFHCERGASLLGSSQLHDEIINIYVFTAGFCTTVLLAFVKSWKG